jgi:aspartyl-tRNA(Asn)/glutamyl-tRNA(Gln) amidotransferase subunit A
MSPDLTAAALDIRAGRRPAAQWLDEAIARADRPAHAHTFIRRFDADARVAAQQIDARHRAGAALPPLAGLAVSVKDLFDVAGHPTTAGSRSMLDAPPATADAVAVARLRAAGAALVGHTNLTEFAYSGVGINRHHGTPGNPATAALDPDNPRIPGGSTSGGAVSVATGAAWAALGSDTGGSIRIPAALQGLVGFKCTARLVPAGGCIPLSTTLDTVCAITRSVRDALLVHGVLAGAELQAPQRPLESLRLAVPRGTMLDQLDPPVARSFGAALRALRDGGATVDEIDLSLLDALSRLQAQGGFAAAEAWAWHRERLAQNEALYDPRVARRIRRGATITPADYAALQHERTAGIAAFEQAVRPYDALLSPTVPVVAPPLQALEDDDDAFFAVNALLLRNPSVVNLLDGCAISLPCHDEGDWPVGLMLWAPALADERLLGVARAVEAALTARR